MKKRLLLSTLVCWCTLSYSQILIDNHNKAVDLLNESQALIQNKQYAEALPKIEDALELDSIIRDAYLLIYTASYYIKDTQTPKRYLQKATSIFEEDDEIVYYLGKVYELEKDFDKAMAAYTEAIRWGKQNGEDYPIVYDYYASRGSCYLRKNQYEEALADFDYSLKLNKNKGAVYANRGLALYNLKRADEACESWKKASELGINSAQTYITRYCK